jgi:UDP-N-acetylmuramoyl-tripeptide--D-alanyl-D-alanine ligase
MKRLLRHVVASILEGQVKRLQNKKDFKVVAVVGSIGKTSTKLAIGKGLSRVAKVRYQEGNYNDRLTIPLVIFGHENPTKVWYFWSWLSILLKNEALLRRSYPYEWVVLELGTDAPGQIIEFDYLKVDLAVVTAITPEHMANFDDLDAVAKEELSVAIFAKNLLINADLCNDKYLQHLDGYTKTYGTNASSDIVLSSTGVFEIFVQKQAVYNNQSAVILPKRFTMTALLGTLLFAGHGDKATLRTVVDEELNSQTPGRLQVLAGIKESTIIDDTYNASPAAVLLALDVLKQQTGPQKIAILGSMNELGKVSEAEHKKVGKACHPKDIDLLVTIGKEASVYLAPAAKANGCRVETFTNPFEAGLFVKDTIKNKAVILAKGSQNGVFAEEALKPLLKNRYDEKKLVRQTNYWVALKQKSFQ